MLKTKDEEKLMLQIMISDNEEEHRKHLVLKEQEIALLNDSKIKLTAEINSLKD
jgi:hypothetical protein